MNWRRPTLAGVEIPEAVRVRIIEGSKLKPPLGAVRGPEVRHLNLLWSVARLDALAIALRSSAQSVEHIAANFRALPQEIERLAREMGVVIRVRHTQQ